MKFMICMFCTLVAWPVAVAGSESQSATSASDRQSDAQVVEIVGGSYFFKPDRISVRANVPVELSISKEAGKIPHNFVIDAPQAGVKVEQEIAKDPETIRFTFTKPGEYTFYCSHKFLAFKSHRERGMVGTIVVTP